MTMAVCNAFCLLVPRSEAVRRELLQPERNREIREAFDGRNYEGLACGVRIPTRHTISVEQDFASHTFRWR